MLAYLFWHRPLDRSATEAYEAALMAFHRSLARTPPIGLCGSTVFRVAELPWLPAQTASERGVGPWYEDWYLLADFTALGVLNEAAVGRGHRSTHDAAASRFGGGAGGLYGLIEGDRSEFGRRAGGSGVVPRATASLAVWIARPPGAQPRGLGELLGDGMDPRRASLWRRQLVFGPAPEFCVLASEPPAGAASARLPAGWTANTLEREVLWTG